MPYMFDTVCSWSMKTKASPCLSTVNRKGVEPGSRKSGAPTSHQNPKSPNLILIENQQDLIGGFSIILDFDFRVFSGYFWDDGPPNDEKFGMGWNHQLIDIPPDRHDRQLWRPVSWFWKGLLEQGPRRIPSDKLTVCYWTWPWIVDLPIKNGDFP